VGSAAAKSIETPLICAFDGIAISSDIKSANNAPKIKYRENLVFIGTFFHL
jgi:hypothetical protein